MNKNCESILKVYGKKILGLILVIAGTVGLFLPFLQGILMIVAGLILLGNKKLADKVRIWAQSVKAFIKRLFGRNQ